MQSTDSFVTLVSFVVSLELLGFSVPLRLSGNFL